jgi:hypothetical protein
MPCQGRAKPALFVAGFARYEQRIGRQSIFLK